MAALSRVWAARYLARERPDKAAVLGPFSLRPARYPRSDRLLAEIHHGPSSRRSQLHGLSFRAMVPRWADLLSWQTLRSARLRLVNGFHGITSRLARSAALNVSFATG